MTVRELHRRLGELVEQGRGEIPVAFDERGTAVDRVEVQGDLFMQTVCYLMPKPADVKRGEPYCGS